MSVEIAVVVVFAATLALAALIALVVTYHGLGR